MRFTVRDNGKGIPPEDLQRIFHRFIQREADRTDVTSGFGLGLGIARELVNLSFGSVEVDSVVGEGTEFSISIPVADPKTIVNAYTRYLQGVHESLRLSVFRVELRDQPEKLRGLLNRCIGRDDVLMPASSVVERVRAVVQKHQLNSSGNSVLLDRIADCTLENLISEMRGFIPVKVMEKAA